MHVFRYQAKSLDLKRLGVLILPGLIFDLISDLSERFKPYDSHFEEEPEMDKIASALLTNGDPLLQHNEYYLYEHKQLSPSEIRY